MLENPFLTQPSSANDFPQLAYLRSVYNGKGKQILPLQDWKRENKFALKIDQLRSAEKLHFWDPFFKWLPFVEKLRY